MKKVLRTFSKCLLVVSIASFGVGISKAQTSQPTQKKPLTLTNILVALGSQKITDMEEKNRILIEAVVDRGVTFAVTPEIEDELKRAGASEILINTIKMKTQVSQPSNPNPPVNPQPALDYTAFEKRADSYVQKGKYELAIPLYDQAIAINSRVSALYVKRGFALFNTQDYDLALLDYNKAIELNPKDSLAFFYRAQLYEKSGNLQEALEDYQKATELDPNNEQAKTALKNVMAKIPKPAPSPPQEQVASNTKPPIQPPVTPAQPPSTPNTTKNEPPKNEPVKPSTPNTPKNEIAKNEPPKNEPVKPSTPTTPRNEIAKNEPAKPEKPTEPKPERPQTTEPKPENQAVRTPQPTQPVSEKPTQPVSENRNPTQPSGATQQPSVQPSAPAPSPKPVTEEQINSIIESDLDDVIIGVGQITASDIVRLVKPVYPQVAQRAGIVGQVKVEVTWDGQGKVISAKAVEGHSLLRGVCEDAARKSEFKPKMIEGKPVKARGFLVYNFARQQ